MEIELFMAMNSTYDTIEEMSRIFNLPLKELLEKYGLNYDEYLTHKAELEDEPHEGR